MRPRRARRFATATTMWCVAGLVVAGIGLACCVHLSAQRDTADEPDPATAAGLEFVTPTSPAGGSVTAPATVARSKMLLGTVETIGSDRLVLRMSDGRRHDVAITSATRFESEGPQGRDAGSGDDPRTVEAGDLVVVHVLVDGTTMTADLVIDGRVTTSRP